MAPKEKVMKAICVHKYVKDLSEIKTSQVPVPTWPPSLTTTSSSSSSKTQPQPQSALLVRVTRTSPTHVDTLYAQGLHQNNHAGLVKPPFILGIEFAGIVVDTFYPESSDTTTISTNKSQTSSHTLSSSPPSTESNHTHFHKGDQIWGSHTGGTFTAYIVCSPATVHHIPPKTTLSSIAGLGATTFPVSYGALIRQAKLQPNETVLVHAAAGGLGVAAVMIARAIGVKVIGTVGSEAKARIVESLLRGNNDVLPPGCGVVRYDQPNWEAQVLRLSQSKTGVDVTFDTVGLVRKSIRCSRYGARIVIVGFVGLGGKMEEVPMNRILLKGVHVMGYRFGESGRRNKEEDRRTWEGVSELLAHHRIEPVVYRTCKGLDQVPGALGELAGRKVYGKIVVEVTDEDAGGDSDEIYGGLVSGVKKKKIESRL